MMLVEKRSIPRVTEGIESSEDQEDTMANSAAFQRVHTNIKRVRGRASDYQCRQRLGQKHTDRADEWALIGMPVSLGDYAITENNSRGLVYVNDDPMAYEPMCKSCHKKYDEDSHPEQAFKFRCDQLLEDLQAGLSLERFVFYMDLCLAEKKSGEEYEAEVKAQVAA